MNTEQGFSFSHAAYRTSINFAQFRIKIIMKSALFLIYVVVEAVKVLDTVLGKCSTLSFFQFPYVFDRFQVADLWEILQPCGDVHRHSGLHLQRQRGCTHEARGKGFHVFGVSK